MSITNKHRALREPVTTSETWKFVTGEKKINPNRQRRPGKSALEKMINRINAEDN